MTTNISKGEKLFAAIRHNNIKNVSRFIFIGNITTTISAEQKQNTMKITYRRPNNEHTEEI